MTTDTSLTKPTWTNGWAKAGLTKTSFSYKLIDKGALYSSFRGFKRPSVTCVLIPHHMEGRVFILPLEILYNTNTVPEV